MLIFSQFGGTQTIMGPTIMVAQPNFSGAAPPPGSNVGSNTTLSVSVGISI